MDFWGLVSAGLFGIVGMAYFMYGKKQQRWIPLFSGLALMIFPYFVSNLFWVCAIGLVLVTLPYFF